MTYKLTDNPFETADTALKVTTRILINVVAHMEKTARAFTALGVDLSDREAGAAFTETIMGLWEVDIQSGQIEAGYTFSLLQLWCGACPQAIWDAVLQTYEDKLRAEGKALNRGDLVEHSIAVMRVHCGALRALGQQYLTDPLASARAYSETLQ